MNIHWQTKSRFRYRTLPPGIRHILLDSGSLTESLEKYCNGNFNLQLIRQAWQRPLPDESMALNLGNSGFSLVREIFLRCDDIPLVYGRSIFPVQTITGAERRLAHWGRRPLGDYLFSAKNIRRSQIEIARITPNNSLYYLIRKNINFKDTGLWGRRSIFYLKNKPLLIVEVFLPEIVRCMTQNKK